MWWELSKVRYPTFVADDELSDEYQKVLIFIARPRELSFMSEKLYRLRMLQVIQLIALSHSIPSFFVFDIVASKKVFKSKMQNI